MCIFDVVNVNMSEVIAIKEYCERCGRLNTCPRTCKYTKDFNGYELSNVWWPQSRYFFAIGITYSITDYDSGDEESLYYSSDDDSTVSYESTEEETSDSEDEDGEVGEVTKCW